jgi:hypothetical protein
LAVPVLLHLRVGVVGRRDRTLKVPAVASQGRLCAALFIARFVENADKENGWVLRWNICRSHLSSAA